MNKLYFNYIIDTFEADIYVITDDDFSKRSSITKKGGRPYLHSPREMGKQMVIYFRNCIENDQPFMVTGLCLQIGISRRGLWRLEKSSKDEFVHIIEKGKQIISLYLEIQAHSLPNPRLPIFILKNMGWGGIPHPPRGLCGYNQVVPYL